MREKKERGREKEGGGKEGKEVIDHFKIFNEKYGVLGNMWESERLVEWRSHD